MIGEVDAPTAIGTLHAGASCETVDTRIGEVPASREFR
jgi:hypothetical protein